MTLASTPPSSWPLSFSFPSSFSLSSIPTATTLVPLALALALLGGLGGSKKGRRILLDGLARVYCTLFLLPDSEPTNYLLSDSHVPLSPSEGARRLRLRQRQRGYPIEVIDERSRPTSGGQGHSSGEQGRERWKEGDLVRSWDQIVEWDDDCVPEQVLQRWRHRSDPLADAALTALQHLAPSRGNAKGRGPQDLLDTLSRAVAEPHRASDPNPKPNPNPGPGPDPELEPLTPFWDAIDRRPPRGAGALSEEWYAARDARLGRVSKARAADAAEAPDSRSDLLRDDWPAWDPFESSEERADAALSRAELEAELGAESEIIRRGQNVFYKYAGPMLLALLHFSLAAGFASPRITAVLRQTAYLIPGERGSTANGEGKVREEGQKKRSASAAEKAHADRTWTRLLETTQFVLDVMQDPDSMRPPSLLARGATRGSSAIDGSSANESTTMDASKSAPGEGWQSAIRVRLLHTVMRARVLGAAGARGGSVVVAAGVGEEQKYSVERDGIPINQEDLAATLASFSCAPLYCLQRMGLRPSASERSSFLALWRHIGFYMGVEPRILRTCFGDAKKADRFLFSAVLHLFGQLEVRGGLGVGPAGVGQEGKQIRGPTIPVLRACADRPPFHTPIEAHFAIARHLLGPTLSTSLGIPSTPPHQTLLTHLSFLGMRLQILFGHYWPRAGWERERVMVMRPLLRRLICWSAGGKRTRFGVPDGNARKDEMDGKDETDGKDGREDKDGREGKEGKDEKDPTSVTLDPEEGQRIVKRWRALNREMVLGSLLVGALVLGLGLELCIALSAAWVVGARAGWLG